MSKMIASQYQEDWHLKLSRIKNYGTLDGRKTSDNPQHLTNWDVKSQEQESISKSFTHTHNLVQNAFKNWIKTQKIHVLLFDKLAKINIGPTGW